MIKRTSGFTPSFVDKVEKLNSLACQQLFGSQGVIATPNPPDNSQGGGSAGSGGSGGGNHMI